MAVIGENEQACTHSSPNTGPLREDAAPWCLAPFEPEGLLRFVNNIVGLN